MTEGSQVLTDEQHEVPAEIRRVGSRAERKRQRPLCTQKEEERMGAHVYIYGWGAGIVSSR